MNLILRITVALVAAAFPALAQTAAEQLQKGIFAQESQGKTDEAITIYRQLANSTLTPREIAAQAQYRLSQSLLQKGDIATATREMERLEREFPEYGKLISSLATSKGIHVFTPGVGIPPTAIPPSLEVKYNMTSVAFAQGKVIQVNFVNPTTWLRVQADGKEYRVDLASPNSLFRSGFTKDTVKAGEDIQAMGPGAKDGSPAILANTVKSADGRILFDRSKLPPPPSPEEIRRAEEALTRQALEKAQKGK